MKLWAGRLTGQVDERLNALNASIGFDSRMYREDIMGSIAHAKMLGAQRIIPIEDAEQIVEGLKSILEDIDAGRVEFSVHGPQPERSGRHAPQTIYDPNARRDDWEADAALQYACGHRGGKYGYYHDSVYAFAKGAADDARTLYDGIF